MSRNFVRICAALIILRSFTNFAKLFQGEEATLVLFGQILRGGAAAVPSLIVGLFMLATGVGLLLGARWALPLIAAYAAYVAINLLTWSMMNPGEFVHVGARFSSATDPDELHRLGVLAFLGYCLIAIGTTAGPAWLLWKNSRSGSSPVSV